MTKKDHEISQIGKHYHQLFKATEQYLTRGKRNRIPTLYRLAKLHGKDRSRHVANFCSHEPVFKGLRNVADPRSIFIDYLNRLREIRRDSKPEEYESKLRKALRGEDVEVKGRYFCPTRDVRWVANRIRDWRPNLIGQLSIEVSTYSLKKEISLEGGRLVMTPHEARLRKQGAEHSKEMDEHIPLIATDRFIMWFADGVPEKICDGDDVMVAFITDGSKPRVTWGWLSKHGSEFGCATTRPDARKAAKMRAVRKAKKALGLV